MTVVPIQFFSDEQKVQDVAADQFRKNDKFTKKAKGTDNTDH